MSAARELAELIRWLRRCLEKVHDAASNQYVRINLHAMIRACDPGTNPRLRRTLADVDREEDARRGRETVASRGVTARSPGESRGRGGGRETGEAGASPGV